MSRPLTATITNATAQPVEGMLVSFAAVPVTGFTDAGGGVTVALEPGTSYRLALPSPTTIDGVLYPAGTVLLITVPHVAQPEDPEAEPLDPNAPVTLADCAVQVIDGSLTALLDRLAALEGGQS